MDPPNPPASPRGGGASPQRGPAPRLQVATRGVQFSETIPEQDPSSAPSRRAPPTPAPRSLSRWVSAGYSLDTELDSRNAVDFALRILATVLSFCGVS
jgi:hypothetical protein